RPAMTMTTATGTTLEHTRRLSTSVSVLDPKIHTQAKCPLDAQFRPSGRPKGHPPRRRRRGRRPRASAAIGVTVTLPGGRVQIAPWEGRGESRGDADCPPHRRRASPGMTPRPACRAGCRSGSTPPSVSGRNDERPLYVEQQVAACHVVLVVGWYLSSAFRAATRGPVSQTITCPDRPARRGGSPASARPDQVHRVRHQRTTGAAFLRSDDLEWR